MSSDWQALSNRLADLVEETSRSIVHIDSGARFGASGILWSNGRILTAAHTLRREDQVEVLLADGRKVQAQVAGVDPGTDVALLKADGLGEGPGLRKAANTRLGSFLLAVGRSAERGPTASFGMMSAGGESWTTWRGGKLDRLIRLDLNLYPGSSGGAVLDLDGNLVGMATAGLTRIAPVAVPVETLDRIAGELARTGTLKRGYLGVSVQPVALPASLQSGKDTQAGLMVFGVESGGAADKAGVLLGDILLTLDGKRLDAPAELHAVLGPGSAGKQWNLSLLRAGATQDVSITPGERPAR